MEDEYTTSVIENNLWQRFSLVNQYCDTSEEPVTFNSVKKFWRGGDDILDYVMCYATRGDPGENVPGHWHYVSFGLSDIHNHPSGRSLLHHAQGMTGSRDDGSPTPKISGMGFELTFRLKSNMTNPVPPEWPVKLLQDLARYAYFSQTEISSSDFIAWGSPLDYDKERNSQINQMLVGKDPTIPLLETPTGLVSFHQIVGITTKELEIAQQWNVTSLLDLFKEIGLGGTLLVTDMERNESVTKLYPHTESLIHQRINRDGCNLSVISSRALWTENAMLYCRHIDWESVLTEEERRLHTNFQKIRIFSQDEEEEPEELEHNQSLNEITNQLQNARIHDLTEQGGPQRGNERGHEGNTGKNNYNKGESISEAGSRNDLSIQESFGGNQNFIEASSFAPDTWGENALHFTPIKFDSNRPWHLPHTVHIVINTKTADLIPLALKGRVLNGLNFTIHDPIMEDTITFHPYGAITFDNRSFAQIAHWLHIQLKPEECIKISMDIEALLSGPLKQTFPRYLAWPDTKLAISILEFY